ncbi:hypothetical protein BC962_2282 [Gillisia mitskevichiae]|uniref:Uncharacterized protein n=1 Tax=Gillisia mitskevichiae TaxID=270921 RepID=A0A495PM36_9FLAO|nr:hypothetical protein [Gillisia mitskevichiae]RKS50512.1 hypothetical protein BC962_2282 [Gillisia mitskevichiae]
MKTKTLLKRTIKFAGLLTIFLVLISFKSEEPVSYGSIENSEQLIFNSNSSANLELGIMDNEAELVSKDAYVLLTIDTGKINERNLDSTVVFSNVEGNSVTNSGSPKDFVTTVYKNMKIYWSGEPKDGNSNAVIEILDIERKPNGGAKILRFSTKNHQKKGLEMKIKNKDVEGEELYNVKFSITEGNNIKYFTVDPKLQMGLGI